MNQEKEDCGHLKPINSGSVPVDGSGENHHHHEDEDRLDRIVKDLIRQHEEKESHLEKKISHDDLKAQYSSVLNSNS